MILILILSLHVFLIMLTLIPSIRHVHIQSQGPGFITYENALTRPAPRKPSDLVVSMLKIVTFHL